MNAMAKESGWEINNGGVALMWRGGCIIRSAFLGKIKEAFDRDPKLTNLLLDPYFTGEIDRAQAGWRRVVRRRRDQRHPAPGDDLGPGLLRRLPHATGSPPTCSRPSATSSAPTPTSGSTSPAASSSTPTGPAGAARRPRRPTTSELRRSIDRPSPRPGGHALGPFSSTPTTGRPCLQPWSQRDRVTHLALRVSDRARHPGDRRRLVLLAVGRTPGPGRWPVRRGPRPLPATRTCGGRSWPS